MNKLLKKNIKFWSLLALILGMTCLCLFLAGCNDDCDRSPDVPPGYTLHSADSYSADYKVRWYRKGSTYIMYTKDDKGCWSEGSKHYW